MEVLFFFGGSFFDWNHGSIFNWNLQSLEIPANIVLLKQPAYSSECNPTESLWDFVRDKLGISFYENLKELKNRLIEIANDFSLFRAELRSRLNFKWWNDAVIQK